jgi:hypothetical protein
MLSTLSVVGTNTPAKVPNFDVPPTGLGKAPGLGFGVAVVGRFRSFDAVVPGGSVNLTSPGEGADSFLAYFGLENIFWK